MVTIARTKKARKNREEFVKKRAERPPSSGADRAANEAIATATKELRAARTSRERKVALALLRRAIDADQARLDQNDRAAAVRAANDEIAFIRRSGLTDQELVAALTNAAHAIADESDDARFASFVPTEEDVALLAKKIRHRVRGMWFVSFLASRTGAFGEHPRDPKPAEARAVHLKDALKHTPAVRRLSQHRP